ncbi:MAG: hypothetical protein NTX91_00155 [candidate division SR1 bacterium]|nr:hypothetical protein [candidate division SR1 bacterium]
MGKFIIYLAIAIAAGIVLCLCLLFNKRKSNYRERTIKKQKKQFNHFFDRIYSKHKMTEHEIEKFAKEAALFSIEVFDNVPISYRETGAMMKDIILKRGDISEEIKPHERSFILRAESAIKTMLQNI